ncbi:MULTISPECIES: hypothetical protein [Acetobacteraceae]|jgi:hypothetical protein|uniref:hypothetical protein n=1 Tax=Acetobacteraceae TaxID=433 RepID=UPI000789B1AD|nr:hypothetical protein [Novacetimonas hansenii]PYD70704.1 hypothetical protein CFR74_15310 [Novacetimonas hansenii]RFP04156.1 hypothetical protein BGC30_00420 [Novacetimonas hansenii]WEQ60515.1 hypothetical protein LV563_14970 [Novacetimonas hansenii]CUW48747.1 hypothetical protein ATCC53582_02894 [Novacetimonas hansenii]
MADDFPRVGQVIDYHYLWKWQDLRGETEGRKKRPSCVVVVAIDRDGKHHLFILPITSKEPAADRQAVLIPETEARRAKLNTDMPLWVMVDEVNYDILETSYTLEDRAARGQFSPAFSKQIVLAFRSMRDAQALRISKRT